MVAVMGATMKAIITRMWQIRENSSVAMVAPMVDPSPTDPTLVPESFSPGTYVDRVQAVLPLWCAICKDVLVFYSLEYGIPLVYCSVVQQFRLFSG